MSDQKDLLIEIGTEELPPKALRGLAQAFVTEIIAGLDKADLSHDETRWYATPRRLAVHIGSVITAQQDKKVSRRGPALAAAYDENGDPTKAAEGFAKSCGVNVTDLDTVKTDKGEWLSYELTEKGRQSIEVIPGVIDHALSRLPIPKRMRWGSLDSEFVRPVHWILVLFGDDVVPCRLLEIDAGNKTRGHRFHHPGEIEINKPDEYLSKLKQDGKVIADYQERKGIIQKMVQEAAATCGGVAHIDPALLDEVTSLVEWPVVIVGEFNEKYLKLPREVLISTMQSHQKYFPVQDKSNNLIANFITIVNIESQVPEEIKKGNERVIHPRLTDAAFFWQRDCAKPLMENVEGLKSVIFQKQLGTLFDKSKRVRVVASHMAEQLNLDENKVTMAVELAKCDLLTSMVGEFPELQGIMGAYYAIESGLDEEVAIAIREQYMPGQAGAEIPASDLGQILSAADKLDTIVGIFSIGQAPTGEKDPFALRRAALGCLRIFIEGNIDLDLLACLEASAKSYQHEVKAEAVVDDAFNFMMERLRRYYLDTGISPFVFDAVLDRQPLKPLDFHQRVQAVSAFSSLPEAENLVAANKRIGNILKQAEGIDNIQVDIELLREPAEQKLNEAMISARETIEPLLKTNDYASVMNHLAGLRKVIDIFFDDVMVMSEDEAIKSNRIALLVNLRELFLTTADISRLQGS